jgi:N-acetylmuramoyl-L-alanine amidase
VVEASWSLGDRLLYLTSPHTRGDDVAALQADLGRLGFDCGRVDGIFGPLTLQALEDFQANCGVVPDGVCGAETVRMIRRVISQTGTGPGIAVVRELELLRDARPSLSDMRIVVGQFGALGGLARGISRQLRGRRAHVMLVDEPDAVAQARAANEFRANVYLGFQAQPDPGTTVNYYRVPTFESVGGRSLAERLVQALRPVTDLEPEVVGRRLPVLRETRMPAVLCQLGSVREVTSSVPDLVDAVVDAVLQWNEAPLSRSP